MTYHCGCWPWSPGCGCVYSGFSTVTLLPSRFSLSNLWKKVTMYSLHLRVRKELCSASQREEHLHKLFGVVPHGIFVYSTQFFIHSCVYISVGLWYLFSTLRYNPILLYFDVPSLSIRHCLFSVPLIHPSLWGVFVLFFYNFLTFKHHKMLHVHLGYFLLQS